MKTMRALMLIVSLGLALALPAQTIEFIVLDRQQNFVQTTAGSASLAGGTPYEFVVDVNGTGLGAPPFVFTFKKPGDLATDYTSFVREPGKEWQAPGPEGSYQFVSMGGLHSLFPDGTYTIQTNLGNTSALSIPNLISTLNDGFANTPFVIGTQNSNPVTWFGNRMMVDPTKELTLTTNVFADNFQNTVDRIGVWVSGNSLNWDASNETPPNSFLFSGNTVTMQIAANSMTPGTYFGNVEFNNVVSSLIDLSTDFGVNGPNANGVSVYTAFTRFEIQAVPEPSTYAAIVGAVAMAGAMLRRRWRTV